MKKSEFENLRLIKLAAEALLDLCTGLWLSGLVPLPFLRALVS